jgi:hypothetical protein
MSAVSMPPSDTNGVGLVIWGSVMAVLSHGTSSVDVIPNGVRTPLTV